MSRKIITVVGARPQFIKSAVLSAALRGSPTLEEAILHTGQHFDEAMSTTFFRELDIPEPAWRLALGGGSHGAMTGRMLEQIESILVDARPDMVVVFGDTNSTLAGALAAVKLRIPVAHVEAGLRSFNFYQPEEINRVMTDRISAILYAPTPSAAAHLSRENVPGRIEVVGDIMFDSTLLAMRLNGRSGSGILGRLGLEPGAYTLATMHRAENVDDAGRFRTLLAYIRDHASTAAIVLPLHPRTRKRAQEFGIDLTGLTVIEPVGYLDSIALLEGATELFSDSGGMQKEAFFCRTPCVTLRDETEWTETVDAGWNRLWTTPHYHPRTDTTAFGDGHTGQAIVRSMERYLA